MKKKRTYLLWIVCMAIGAPTFAQVGINTSGAKPDGSAQLDISSTDKGVLIPRMTTAQRNAIGSPALGLLVFDTDKGVVMFFDGRLWQALAFTNADISIPQSENTDSPVAYAHFGTQVAISGKYAVIGAPNYSSNGVSRMGSAYIFYKGPSGWQQQAKLVAWDSAENDYFGGAVTISGDYIAIGSAFKTIGANTGQGKVYIYHRSGANWVSDSSVTKPTGASDDYFGESISLSDSSSGGPALLVGIPNSAASGKNQAGEVYAFNRGASGWTFTQSIVAADLAAGDGFGWSSSAYGNYAVVGAPEESAVYIYIYADGLWTLQQKKVAGNGAGFGSSTAIFEDRLAVGAPSGVFLTNTSAAVYLYKRTGTTWSNVNQLYIYNSEASVTDGRLLDFGEGLALDESNLLIGAPGGYPISGGFSNDYQVGGVYFYKDVSGNGSYSQRVQAVKSSFPSAVDLFGASIGFDGGSYIIGSPGASVGGSASAGNVFFGAVTP